MAEFKVIVDGGMIPIRGTEKSAGYDLYANEDVVVPAHGHALVKTGITIEMEDNEYLAIVPRSGLALKQGITVLNTPGTVDADYYPNEIGVILYNTNDLDFEVSTGDRIAQGILQEYKCTQTDRVANSSRVSGFGSTGK